MSRSNPTLQTPNPAVRFFEWNGERGLIHYYDRAAKARVDIGDKFTFILLDQLATVKGWHEPSESGIYSNEVRDTRTEPMTVRAFKGGELAKGLYAAVKDRIAASGGHFTANCYIAFKGDDGNLLMGALQFKGAALSSWFEFCKQNRAAIYEKAIAINGFAEGKKGKVTFRVPIFKTAELAEASNEAAKAIDVELQAYLAGYFERTKVQGVAQDAVGDSDEVEPLPGDIDGSPFNEEGVTTGTWKLAEAVAACASVGLTSKDLKAELTRLGRTSWLAGRDTPTIQDLIASHKLNPTHAEAMEPEESEEIVF